MGDNKPIGNIKGYGAAGLQIAVWPGHEGQTSFTISKRFKDKNTQEWKDSKVLFLSDLMALLGMIPEAARVANKYSEQKYQEKKAGGSYVQSHGSAEVVTFDNAPDYDSDLDIPF